MTKCAIEEERDTENPRWVTITLTVWFNSADLAARLDAWRGMRAIVDDHTEPLRNGDDGPCIRYIDSRFFTSFGFGMPDPGGCPGPAMICGRQGVDSEAGTRAAVHQGRRPAVRVGARRPPPHVRCRAAGRGVLPPLGLHRRAAAPLGQLSPHAAGALARILLRAMPKTGP